MKFVGTAKYKCDQDIVPQLIHLLQEEGLKVEIDSLEHGVKLLVVTDSNFSPSNHAMIQVAQTTNASPPEIALDIAIGIDGASIKLASLKWVARRLEIALDVVGAEVVKSMNLPETGCNCTTT